MKTLKMLFHGRDFIDKVIVVAAEAGVLDRIEFIIQQPFDADAIIWRYSPLGRHPALVLPDGTVLCHGLLVCEYLDSLGTGPSLFPSGPMRWRAKALSHMGDGLFDATSALVVQGLRPPADRNRGDIARLRERILHLLPAMDAEAARFGAQDFHIGHVCFASGLNFFDLRKPLGRVMLEAGDDHFDWRSRHPRLAAWYDRVLARPSLQLRPSQLGIASQHAPAPEAMAAPSGR